MTSQLPYKVVHYGSVTLRPSDKILVISNVTWLTDCCNKMDDDVV